VVAVAANHLAFAERHVRRAIELRAPVLVALEAGLRLPCGLQVLLQRDVAHDGMAVGALQAARLVCAAVPVGAVAALVAAEADRIVFLGRAAEVVRTERDEAADAPSAARLDVQRARTVAVLALELARG